MRARLLRPLAAALLWLACASAQAAGIAVVVHPESPLRTLSAREVSDLYLGRVRSVAAGDRRIPVTVIEQPADSPLRAAFFRALNGMGISQVNAYWARLRFSGEVLPPPALPDSRAVVDAVGRDPSAIGYIDATAATPAVRTILLLAE